MLEIHVRAQNDRIDEIFSLVSHNIHNMVIKGARIKEIMKFRHFLLKISKKKSD